MVMDVEGELRCACACACACVVPCSSAEEEEGVAPGLPQYACACPPPTSLERRSGPSEIEMGCTRFVAQAEVEPDAERGEDAPEADADEAEEGVPCPWPWP